MATYKGTVALSDSPFLYFGVDTVQQGWDLPQKQAAFPTRRQLADSRSLPPTRASCSLRAKAPRPFGHKASVFAASCRLLTEAALSFLQQIPPLLYSVPVGKCWESLLARRKLICILDAVALALFTAGIFLSLVYEWGRILIPGASRYVGENIARLP